MQRCRPVGPAERAGAPVVEEAWPAQAGDNEDGSGGHGASGRCAEHGDQVVDD